MKTDSESPIRHDEPDTPAPEPQVQEASPPKNGAPVSRRAVAAAAIGLVIALIGAALALSNGSGDGQVAITAGDNIAVTQAASPIDAHNSPAVAVDPTDPSTVVVAGRVDRPRFSAAVHASRDGGETWDEATFPVPAGQDRPFAPDIAFDDDGTLHLLFTTLEGEGNSPGAVWLSRSTDRGETFSDPERVTGAFAFQSRLAVDAASGRIHITWLQATAEAISAFDALLNPPHPIVMVTSEDGGSTFSEPVTVSDPARLRVGAATPVVGPDGTVHVLYQDFGDDVRDFEGLEGPVHEGSFELVLTRSEDDGATFDDGTVVEPAVVPTERFLVYLPKFPSIAVDDDARIYVSWAGGGASAEDSDVFLRRSDDGGATWSRPVTVGDDPSGMVHQQYLPRVAVAPDGRVDVLYFDRRDDPEDVLTTAALATSFDRGETFSTVVVSDTAFDSRVGPGSERNRADPGTRLGLASFDDAAYAVWTDTRRGTLDTDKQDLFIAAVSIDG